MLASRSPRAAAQPLTQHTCSLRPSPVHAACSRRCLQRRVHCRVYEDENMSLAELQAQLNAAIEAEEYEKAASIRDTLQKRQLDSRLAVEDANTRFYQAFMSGNLSLMAAVWGKGDHVQVIHPGASCISSRELVMESWGSILRGVRPGAFKIHVEDVRTWASDTAGFVTCVEVVEADDSQGRTIATNIFEKQNGKWVITHHHGSPLVRFR